MGNSMKAAAAVALGLLIKSAWAIPIHSTDGLDVFSMSSAGEWADWHTISALQPLALQGTAGKAHGMIQQHTVATSLAADFNSKHKGSAVTYAGWVDVLALSSSALTGQVGVLVRSLINTGLNSVAAVSYSIPSVVSVSLDSTLSWSGIQNVTHNGAPASSLVNPTSGTDHGQSFNSSITAPKDQTWNLIFSGLALTSWVTWRHKGI